MVRKTPYGYGPAGSGVSYADGFTKFPPSEDSDMMWKYRQEIVVPQSRLPDANISLEEFEDLLIGDPIDFENTLRDMVIGSTISPEEFEQMILNPETTGRRITAKRNKARMMKNQQHFAIIERNAWNADQLTILRLLDRDKQLAKKESWEKSMKTWTADSDELKLKMLKAYPSIKSEHGKELADEWKDYGFAKIEAEMPARPEDDHNYISFLRNLARKLVLWDDVSNMTIEWLTKVAPVLQSREVPTPFTRILIGQIYDMAKQNDYERYTNFSEQFRIAFALD